MQNITCTATASINGVPIGQVTATTNATVWEPYYYIGHHVGDINYLDDQAGVQAGDGIGVKPGVKFLGAVGTQDLFKDYYGWAGIWQYVQLCKLSRTQYTWGNPFPFITNTDGEFMLDNKYPYEGWWLANSDSEDYPLQIGETEDNPSQDFIIHSVSIDVSDLFSMYMMYLPPGPDVQWVPLHRIDWGWTAQASYSGQMQSWIPVPPSGSVSVSRSQRWTDHPTWEHIYLNIGG